MQSLEYAVQSDNKTVQKEACIRLRKDCNVLRDYPNAVDYFQKYQTMAKLTDDKEGEVDINRLMGMAYFDMNDHDAAFECFQNSVRLAIEIQDKVGLEEGYNATALAYIKLAKYERAIEHFEKVLNLAIEKRNRKKEAKAYENIGKAYIELKNHSKGIEYLNKCLMVPRETPDKPQEQIVHWFIGKTYYSLGNFKEAIKNYERCLSLSIETRSRNFDEERLIYDLGLCYHFTGNHEKAIEFLESTLSSVVGKNKLAEATTLVTLGNVYLAVARYEEAFESLDKCMRISVELGNICLQSKAQLNIAHAHFVLGNNENFVKYLNESIERGTKSGNKTCMALAYRALVVQALNDKDYMTMLEHAKKGLELVENGGNKYEQQHAYLDIGTAYYSTGNEINAKKYLEKSLDLAKEIGDRSAEAQSSKYLGDLYMHGQNLSQLQDSTEKAFQYYEQHANVCNVLGDKSRVGEAYCNLGILFARSYVLRGESPEHKEKAEDYFNKSLRSYNSFFENLGEDDERKISFMERYLKVHKHLVFLYINTGEFEKALLVSEQERGRALEDILKRKYKLDDADKPMYALQYADIESRLLTPDTSILFFSDLIRSTGFELQIGTWVVDLENHVSFYRNDLQRIKSFLQEQKLDEELQHREDILCALVDKAYFTISVQRSVDSSEDRSFSINAGTSSAENLQDSLRHLRCVYDERLNENYLEVLYDILIAPIQDRLSCDEIIIIPNGSLFRVPFAALRNPQTGSYLSETKKIRIAPSLNTLKIMDESSAESHSLTGALIVGDPDVNGKRILRGKERSFHPLPNAKVEAEKVGEVLGVEALTGKQASKQVIIERLRQGVAVIHFAAHGCTETGDIILCPSSDHPSDKIPEEKDYLLTISEVQELGLRARLVVLSCCHSGRGDIKSEGVIGISRAFLAAGALAVVASLWAIDDKGTRLFMEQFYTHLKDGKSASTSLQQAMKDMRSMPRYDKPMYWAPFVLIGDDVTINIT